MYLPSGFVYEHGKTATFETSIGKIEVTYQTAEGQKQDEHNSPFGLILEEVNVPYEEPARNKFSFFKDALYRNSDNHTVDITYGEVAELAIGELYRNDGMRRMRADFADKDPGEY